MRSLILLVTYTAKPGMRSNFLREVAESKILETIRRESGCLAYEYFLPAEDGERILLVEKWVTEQQQMAHMEQPHMGLLTDIKNRWIDQTSIERIYLEEGDQK